MTRVVRPELRLIARIAVQFRHLPAEEAAVAVADHVVRFWSVRMKKKLIEEVADDSMGVDPIVLAAVERLC